MIGFALTLLLAFGSFVEPVDIDADIEGQIYVLDQGRDLLIQYSPLGDSLRSVGGYGQDRYRFDRPTAINAGRGNEILVADYNNHRIERYTRQLAWAGRLETRQSESEVVRFGYPLDVTVDRLGTIYVLDGENRRVVAFDGEGRHLRTFGGLGDGRGRLIEPVAMAVDAQDRLWVLDGRTVRIYDAFGTYLKLLTLPARAVRVSVTEGREHLWVITRDGGVMTIEASTLTTASDDFSVSDSVHQIRDVARYEPNLYLLFENEVQVMRR